MNFHHLLLQTDGPVVTLTLNRPAVLNALQPLTCRELIQAFDAFRTDDRRRVAILTGAGDRAFCVGADLKHRVAAAEPETGARPSDELDALLARIHKPIIAAVNGYALGGGLELALRCDLILAAAHATFGLPEVKRGLLADGGGVYHLSHRLPYHAALGLVLTGHTLDAAEALRLGLINALAPAGELAATARQWAEEIAALSPLAVQAAKASFRAFHTSPAPPDLAELDALPAVQRLRESEDYLEGPRAFAEKRPPHWTGSPRGPTPVSP